MILTQRKYLSANSAAFLAADLEYQEAKNRFEASKIKQEAFDKAVAEQAAAITISLQVDSPDFAAINKDLAALVAHAVDHQQVAVVQQALAARQKQVAASAILRAIETHVAASDSAALAVVVSDEAHLAGLQQVAGAADSTVVYTIREATNAGENRSIDGASSDCHDCSR